ncbi:MAG: hypothetical protein JOY61_07780, partial [Chloroflexi bacterium]|nr:hypothetical protein [Chloroflexota bacterium]
MSDGGPSQPYLEQAIRLHAYLCLHHWDGRALTGPDGGVRFNYRVGRFIKSYLDFLPWRDAYYYLQAQGYWVLANWRLLDATGQRRFEDCAIAASRTMLERQRPDGAWDYPEPEWAGRIATAEGTWAAMGLLETYRRTGDRVYADGARNWNEFLQHRVGYSPALGGLAVNYFAVRPGAAVPNNSAFVLRFLSDFALATRDATSLGACEGLVHFLAAAQLPSGELPYSVSHNDKRDGTVHFQCFQYNAFECIDLISYFETSGDRTVLPIASRLLEYLRHGMDRSGRPYYNCRQQRRAVVYHAGAIAAALSAGMRLGIIESDDSPRRAYAWLLGKQRHDGGFPTSFNDYGVLSD